MNVNRLRQLEAQLGGQEKSVYESLGTEHGMTSRDVVSAMGKRGKRTDVDAVEKFLDRLAGRGLAKEQPPGVFKRIALERTTTLSVVSRAAREDEEIEAALDPTPKAELAAAAAPTPEPAPVREPSPFEALAAIERELDEIAAAALQLNTKIQRVRESVTAAAVNVDDHVRQIRDKNSKLEQLKVLLKEIGE